MGYIQDAKQLCLERDAGHCRTCGSMSNLFVRQLTKRKGRLSWMLSNLVTLCGKCIELADKSELNNGNKVVGIMLCGGKGTRLYPLTKFQNKHLLPIGMTNMCFYPLKTLRALGAHRVLVIIDREGAGNITSVLGSGKEFGLDISYKIQDGAGGIGDALYLAKDFVQSDEKIVTILGDNIFDNDKLDKSIDLGNSRACIYTKKVANPSAYGVAIIDTAGKVKEVIEKPKTFISDLAVVGLYLYTPEVFDVIDEIKPSERGELEISAVNDYYAKEGTLVSKDIGSSFWADCGGSIQRYCEASLYGAKINGVSVEEIDNYKSTIFDDK